MKNLPQTTKSCEALLALKKIELEDIGKLNPEERNELMVRINTEMTNLTGDARDAFEEKVKALLNSEAVWEMNHLKITDAIKKYAAQCGSIPDKTWLANNCGLSRQTIHKHLKQFVHNPAWDNKTDAINIMTQDLMGVILKNALQGDMKAAKLYLESAKSLKAGDGVVNNQNNYIQINKTVINQQVIQQLKPEQLQQLEQIIAAAKAKQE